MATPSAGQSIAPVRVDGRQLAVRRRRERSELRDRIPRYLAGDPFLQRLWDEIHAAGQLKAITVDLTHVCQLRCEGCYFFIESMDESKAPKDERVFDEFVAAEKARGTNYITVLGGEPSLQLDRLKKLHENFYLLTVTNGLRKIPWKGFENMPIAISVWGDHEIDTQLRGRGKIDVFARALKHYKDDPRAGWYFTASAGNAHIIESVVSECVANGNYVYFNYYEDNADIGGEFDHRQGFGEVRREIDRMIDLYPESIVSTSYLNKVCTTSELFGQRWGFDVCATVSTNHEKNQPRFRNGNPWNPHFRAYLPDLQNVRRCCVGEARDCDKCYNANARHTWVLINRDQHLRTKQDFTNWLTSAYIFYLTARAIPWEEGVKLLPEIHERTRAARDTATV
jgi:hypothetical protein